MLLQGVNKTYEDTDLERDTLERSVNLFAEEMVRLNVRVESERNHMRLILEQAPVGILRIEIDGRISMANPAVSRILGYSSEEMLALDPLLMIHADDRPAASQAGSGLRSGQSGHAYTGQRRFLHRDGSTVHTNVSVSLVTDSAGQGLFTIAIVEDISEKTRLELDLRHAQKLESVGRLAAGIAHEINTPIQFVGDSAEFLRAGFTDLLALCDRYRQAVDGLGALVAAEERQALARAAEAADYDYLRREAPKAFDATLDGVARVAKIVQAMKSFAHPDQPGKAPADLNDAIRSTLAVGAHELKYVAEVVTDFAPLPPVPCHLGDINQVLLNLFVNAAHAIGEVVGDSGARGSIRVRTFQQGGEIVIAVQDTGAGIPEEIRLRIFEPFFTTKEVGRGSGQGLAISRAVIERHGGTLTFDTELGKGTTFWVRLPLAEGATQAA
jgi:PAS domain S-box-containing protein